MAVETISITRAKPAEPGMDYDLLREQGIAYIQELAGKIWTDYNTHDPGVTLLELLCFAMSELGYRTESDMADLLQDPSGLPSPLKQFFTAAEIAVNAPLTVNDYRKLLIDLPGIKNAWLEKSDKNERPMTFIADAVSPAIIHSTVVNPSNLTLNGLYRVVVQFDEDERFDNLNDNGFTTLLTVPVQDVGQSTRNVDFKVEVNFPLSGDYSAGLMDLQTVVEVVEDPNAALLPVTSDPFLYIVKMIIDPNTANELEVRVTLRVLSPLGEIANESLFRSDLKDTLFPIDPTQSPFVVLVQQFIEKKNYIQTILGDAWNTLHAHRNLGEDFFQILPMNIQDIGVCLQLRVSPLENCERILAEAYHRIGEYFSPSIRFYTLSEMLDRGKTVDEIFNGPWLHNGFIDTDELRTYQRKSVIYTSDVVQILMDIPGVEAVDKVTFSNYIGGRLLGKDAEDCINLTEPERFQPVLNIGLSDITFKKGEQSPGKANEAKALEILGELTALNGSRMGVEPDPDLPVPVGTHLDLDYYYSLQKDLPLNYGVGEEGVLEPQSADRLAKAKQLKGFLMFFEQLLANYFSQLHQVREMLAVDQTGVERTYFTQALSGVPNVQELIQDFVQNHTGTFDNYLNIASPNADHYLSVLNALSEPEGIYEERHNRFLDHLMARFNEQFTDYAIYLFSNEENTSAGKIAVRQSLIEDKTLFLKEYPLLSRDRGQGFDQLRLASSLPDVWNTTNVAGMKKRVARLLGFPDYDRTDAATPQDTFEIYPVSTQWKWRLLNADNISWMVSSGTFATEADAQVDLCEFMDVARELDHYIVHDPLNPKFAVSVVGDPTDPNNTILATTDPALGYDLQLEAEAALPEIMAHIIAQDNLIRFHVVEHILLRPRQLGDDLLDIRMVHNCPALDITDPYSFRLTLVLPAWASPFQDQSFRDLFKKTVRMETPAHIYVHFQWVSRKEMLDFEVCYRGWLADNQTASGAATLLSGAVVPTTTSLNCVLEELTGLKNQYDAVYTIDPVRAVFLYTDGDRMAIPFSTDGTIVWAELLPSSPPLPNGLELDFDNGEIRITQASTYENDAINNPNGFPLEILTLNANGGATCHSIVIPVKLDTPSTYTVAPSQHIATYTLNFPLVVFSDPDTIVLLTLLSRLSDLPPGTAFNYTTFELYVSDPNALVAGVYSFNVETVDSQGGITVHNNVPVHILPDTPARLDIIPEPTDNADSYVNADIMGIISDDNDGGINTAILTVPASQTLADFGLGLSFSDTPQKGYIRIVNENTFWTAFGSLTPDSDGLVHLELEFDTTDNLGGTSTVNEIITFRHDTEAESLISPARNQFAYASGDALAFFKDDNDQGLVGISAPTHDLMRMGVKLQLNTTADNPFAVLFVNNRSNFQSFITSDFVVSLVTGNLEYDMVIETEDALGGKSSLTITLVVNVDNPASTILVSAAANQDTYILGQLMAVIEDDTDGGVVSTASVGSRPIIDYGLALSVGDSMGVGTNRAEITISKVNKFRNAVNDGRFVYNSSSGAFEATLSIQTVDLQGGISTTTVVIPVLQNATGMSQEIQNNVRVNDLEKDDILYLFTDPDSLVSHEVTVGGGLPPGLDFRIISGQIQIIVVDEEALFPGSSSLTIRVTDTLGNFADYPIILNLLPRLIIHDWFIEDTLRSPARIVNEVIYPGLNFVELRTWDASYGSLVAKDKVTEYLFNAKFATLGFTLVAELGGILPDNNNEPVDVRLRIIPPSKSFSGSLGELTKVTKGEGTVTTEADDPIAIVTEQTKAALEILDDAAYNPDASLPSQNGAVVAEFASGQRDAEVTESLSEVAGKTALLIEEADQKARTATGEEQAKAKADLKILGELYALQFAAAVDFAGNVRTNDPEEGGDVANLLADLHSQISRFNP